MVFLFQGIIFSNDVKYEDWNVIFLTFSVTPFALIFIVLIYLTWALQNIQEL